MFITSVICSTFHRENLCTRARAVLPYFVKHGKGATAGKSTSSESTYKSPATAGKSTSSKSNKSGVKFEFLKDEEKTSLPIRPMRPIRPPRFKDEPQNASSGSDSSAPPVAPPCAHVAQRPPKGPRWARRCGEACRCAGGCCSNNCCMGQRSCSPGSTVDGERQYGWQCFGPERASIHERSSSVEAQYGPFTFENEKANETKANENEKSWRWLAAEEDLMPYGVCDRCAAP